MTRQNAILLALSLILLTGPGCASSVGTSGPYSGGPSDWMASSWRGHVWANRAYETTIAQSGQERLYGGDYKRGFVAGYQSICNGADGEIPAVPPRKYWGSRYLSPEGQAKSRAWFEGYPAGVKAAQSDGIDSYRDIYVSQLIDDVHAAQAAGHNPAMGEHMQDFNMTAPESIQPIPVVPVESLDVPPEPTAKKMPRPLNQAFQSMSSMLKRNAS